jgi:hypothetical protein
VNFASIDFVLTPQTHSLLCFIAKAKKHLIDVSGFIYFNPATSSRNKDD